MNDKEYEKQKKRVNKVFNKWRTPLGLGWWRIDLTYSRETSAGGELVYAAPSIGGKFTCAMEVTCDFYYKTAIITFYLPTIQFISDQVLDRYMIHELMHIHLKPMQHPERAKEEELVATSLADAILWTIEAVNKKELK